MNVRCDSVVRTALISPFRISDDRVVVIDELASKPHADPSLFWITGFQICELEVPCVFIRYAVWKLLQKRPRILELRNDFQPGRRSQIHLITKTVQKVGVLLSGREASVSVA